MFRQALEEGLEQLALSFDGQTLARLVRYLELVADIGRRAGVTALREEAAMARELVVDSLAGEGCFPPGARVVDLGSGGGVPGVPLAVFRPDLDLTLLEANGKKCIFLREVIEELSLANVVVLQGRSEEVAHDRSYRGAFEVVTAKAVASLATLIELGIPLLKKDGLLLAYKGPRAAQEIQEAARALQLLSGEVRVVREYSLFDKSYCLVEVRKTGPSPDRYPRRPGQPAKHPLI
ncbi:MAG: 16S rRNA (guanine(527)-N(7))-methyltransferase RsmG [Vulcanimicrobiota bacterium]